MYIYIVFQPTPLLELIGTWITSGQIPRYTVLSHNIKVQSIIAGLWVCSSSQITQEIHGAVTGIWVECWGIVMAFKFHCRANAAAFLFSASVNLDLKWEYMC